MTLTGIIIAAVLVGIAFVLGFFVGGHNAKQAQALEQAAAEAAADLKKVAP